MAISAGRPRSKGEKRMKLCVIRKYRAGAIVAVVLAVTSVMAVPSNAQLPEVPESTVIPEPTQVPEPSTPTVLGVSPEFVTIHDELTILGANLAALKDDYKVTVGGREAHPEVWSETEIRFPMPTPDPGSQGVVLEPKPKPEPVVMPQPYWSTSQTTPSAPVIPDPAVPLLPVDVGKVTVAKYVLPEGEAPVPGGQTAFGSRGDPR